MRRRLPFRPGIVLFVATGIGIAVLTFVGYRVAVADRGASTSLDVLFDAPEFALTDQLGRPVNSTEFQGKVVVANFIYTSCRDICPLLSAHMQALQERLREAGLLGDVQLLSFTVDPTRDTPDVLRKYAERYNADSTTWRFLTGPEKEQAPLIVDGFRLGVQALPPEEETPHPDGHGDDATNQNSYQVMHSGRFILIDREWRIRAYYDGSDFDLDRVLSDLRTLRGE